MNLQKKNTNYHYMALLGKTSKLLIILREKKNIKILLLQNGSNK